MKKIITLLTLFVFSLTAFCQDWMSSGIIFQWKDSVDISLFATDTVIQYNKFTGNTASKIDQFNNLNNSYLSFQISVDMRNFAANNDTLKITFGGSCFDRNYYRVTNFDGFTSAILPAYLIPDSMKHSVNGVNKYTVSFTSGQDPFGFPIPMIKIWRLNASRVTHRYIVWHFRFFGHQ